MLALFALSVLLGVSSFCIGLLPLSLSFKKTHLTRLSYLGTGLLLGTALGVIIPEGVKTLASAHTLADDLPTARVALSLLSGFTLMLITEQLISPEPHWHGPDTAAGKMTPAMPFTATSEEFDAELADLEDEGSSAHPRHRPTPLLTAEDEARFIRERSYPLTLGLTVHALTDGLALGVSFYTEGHTTSNLSFIIFLAILIHKAPTALALTTALMANSLPRVDCKRHLAVFCASTPMAALATSFALLFIHARDEGVWVGTYLLVSGGTFLYVATVLQPISHSAELGDNLYRVVLIVIGIFVPFVLGMILGEH